MHRLRPAFALLFQILLLQVSVLGGGMACAPGWLRTVAAGAASAHHAMPPNGSEHQTPSHHGTAPTHGTVPTHCAAATGCAAIAVTAPDVAVAPIAMVDRPLTLVRASAPRWTHPAPEPPPPRA